MSKTVAAPAEGHNSDVVRQSTLQSCATRFMAIQAKRLELNKEVEDLKKEAEGVGVPRSSFMESINELQRNRDQSEEHKVGKVLCMEALNKMDQADLFAEVDRVRAAAVREKEEAKAKKERAKAEAKRKKEGVVHESADAKDREAKGETVASVH